MRDFYSLCLTSTASFYADSDSQYLYQLHQTCEFDAHLSHPDLPLGQLLPSVSRLTYWHSWALRRTHLRMLHPAACQTRTQTRL